MKREIKRCPSILVPFRQLQEAVRDGRFKRMMGLAERVDKKLLPNLKRKTIFLEDAIGRLSNLHQELIELVELLESKPNHRRPHHKKPTTDNPVACQ